MKVAGMVESITKPPAHASGKLRWLQHPAPTAHAKTNDGLNFLKHFPEKQNSNVIPHSRPNIPTGRFGDDIKMLLPEQNKP